MLDVLVIDDDRTTAAAVSALLTSRGYQCDVAHSSEEAEDVLKHTTFRVILSDVHIGGSDGRQVVAKLRTRPDMKLQRIVAMSEDGECAELARSCQSAGFDGYVPKDRIADITRLIPRLLMWGRPAASAPWLPA